ADAAAQVSPFLAFWRMPKSAYFTSLRHCPALVSDAAAQVAGGAQAGDVLALLENSLKPIERYAVRLLEEFNPVDVEAAVRAALDKMQAGGEGERSFSLDEMVRRKDEAEAAYEDSEDQGLVVEDWDTEAANAEYRQLAEAAQRQMEADEAALAAAIAEEERAAAAAAEAAAQQGLIYGEDGTAMDAWGNVVHMEGMQPQVAGPSVGVGKAGGKGRGGRAQAARSTLVEEEEMSEETTDEGPEELEVRGMWCHLLL
ncbi:hypothetical protein DUNSADRAFT_13884, partial [Dunaliella salina]